MPHARAAEAVGLAMSVQPHVGGGMSDALGCPTKRLMNVVLGACVEPDVKPRDAGSRSAEP